MALNDLDVCYLISHGFAARMVLHSRIIPELQARGLRVGVIAPNANEPEMQALAEKAGVVMAQAPEVSARFGIHYDRLRRYIYEDVKENPALWAKHLRDVEAPETSTARRWQSRLYLVMNKLCQAMPFMRKGLGAIEKRMLKRRDARELLEKLSPKVVVATYPIAPVEACLLYAAKQIGIATVGQLLSWDNISCKGRFLVLPESFISWGPIMSEELGEYYNVAPERIETCGVAHFDLHVTAPQRSEVERILKECGLDPAKPYLFFGMSSPIFAPREIDIVEWLARRIAENAFGDDMQLVVRPHPQNMEGSMADLQWLPRLDALRTARVAVDYPALESSQMAWNMKEADLAHLVNLISGCSVSLNSGSTLSIDSIMQDKPVIVTSFDAEDEFPWWASARRGPEYRHLAKLIALGGIKVAWSYADLETGLQAYLADPALDHAGRVASVTQECGANDGQAAGRVAEALAGFVSKAKGTPVG